MQGQKKDSLQAPSKIVVLSRVQKQENRILLRWGLTTPKAWRKSNLYGVSLKRYTITRNGNTLLIPEEVLLGNMVPKPLEDWRELIEINDNAAVMAQALYGEQFDVEGVDALSAIVNLSQEQEQRFTWAMYVADQDFSVAQKAGLGYVDQTIKSNEKYLYKLTSMVPVEEELIEDGVVFTGIQDYDVLPKPLDLSIVFLDQKAILSWNYETQRRIYNSYFVERSKNGAQFDRLNDLPLSSMDNNENSNAQSMFYIDSIQNNQKYFYRVKGVTPFGEISPHSEVVSGTAKAVLAYVPRIKTKTLLSNNSVKMEWEFLEAGNDFITHFALNQSNQADGQYKVVRSDIPPESRSILYDSLLPTNYFTLTAVGKSGNSRTSFPVLVQPIDSVPPLKPSGLAGEIDSLGIVTLNWKNNKANDLLGYRVFRGNIATEEFSQITVSPHQNNIYYDSIDIRNLNPKIYYYIVAVDQRFNASKRSDVLELMKPDLIPPAKAVFSGFQIQSNTVSLSWANSSSHDVVKHEIYRKKVGEEDWEMVYSESRRQRAAGSGEWEEKSSWVDKQVEAGQQYNYTLIAVDASGLESTPASPLNLSLPKSALKPTIEKLKSFVDREKGNVTLSWKSYVDPEAAEIKVYKGIVGQALSLFQILNPMASSIIDEKLKPNNSYQYIFRVVFKDGSLSQISKHTLNY